MGAETDDGQHRIRRTDNLPDPVRTAIFALKTGEVSEPVKQANGFYLFRAEEITYRPLAEARSDIFNELKQQHYREWLDQTNAQATVFFSNTAFLGAVQIGITPVK